MRINKTITGLIGLLAGAVPLASIFIAISVSPWFSFTGNFLSDLGEGAVPSFLFNAGLMAGGILGTLFGWGMWENRLYNSKRGMKLFLIATVSLFFVGLFPVNTHIFHTVPSVVFFVCATFSLLFIGWTERRKRQFPWFILVLGILSLMAAPLYAVPRPIGFNAITELVTTFAIAAFVLMTSMKILTEP